LSARDGFDRFKIVSSQVQDQFTTHCSMTDTSLLTSIQRLKTLIATQLQWGTSDQWSNYDFEKLADAVAEKTGVTLSVSTLKRVFGRVNYQSDPSVTTLNTLARFVGFEDWRTFINSPQEEPIAETTGVAKTVIERPKPVSTKTFRFLKIAALTVVLLLVGLMIVNFNSRKHKYNPADFSFSSKTVLTEGLPNSVIFDYEASAADDKDSIFISQMWDLRRKVSVNKNDKHYSCIYYYPGYFRAKLMIGNEIIREHDVQIKTDGWLAAIEADWGIEPFYFNTADIVRGNEIVIDEPLLKKTNIDLRPEPPGIRLFNQKDIHNIRTDNFTFETEVKTDFASGANACQRVEILLQAKNDILSLLMVNPACIGDVYIYAYGSGTSSDKEDLSGLGCNLHEWAKLKIVCKDKHIRFSINDKQIYTTEIKNPPAEIVGVQYRFKGVGAVRNTRLSGSGNEEVVF
jgi:hypothetical protein